VPLHDDRLWFEFLILEGAQAGLSWSTVLAKRENYRRVFRNFDVKKVAKFDSGKMERLMQDAGIIRAMRAGSSMAAMSLTCPPQCGQCSTSISNTRFNNCAHRMCPFVRPADRWAQSPASCAGSASGGGTGTTAFRSSVAPQLRIRCQHPMEADQMQSWSWHQCG
jgi:hypothetical protein